MARGSPVSTALTVSLPTGWQPTQNALYLHQDHVLIFFQRCLPCLQAGGSARGLGGSQRLSGTLSGSNIPAGGKGMVLPFDPLDLTFHHLNYYVDLPKVRIPVAWQASAYQQIYTV